MKIYTYWDNKIYYHYKVVFQCSAVSILEADKQLKEYTAIDAIKCSHISCTISSKK